VDSVRKMLEGLKRHFRFSGLVVVFGSSADKDVPGMLGEILAEARCVIATQASHPRAKSAAQISPTLGNGTKKTFLVEPSLPEALKKARSLADADDLVLVTGSLYLVAEARRALLTGAS
jgi:dihydrofolate synthase/folylpolyglutamate synthase